MEHRKELLKTRRLCRMKIMKTKHKLHFTLVLKKKTKFLLCLLFKRWVFANFDETSTRNFEDEWLKMNEDLADRSGIYLFVPLLVQIFSILGYTILLALLKKGYGSVKCIIDCSRSVYSKIKVTLRTSCNLVWL